MLMTGTKWRCGRVYVPVMCRNQPATAADKPAKTERRNYGRAAIQHSLPSRSHLSFLFILLRFPNAELPFVCLLLVQQILEDGFFTENIAIGCTHGVLHQTRNIKSHSLNEDSGVPPLENGPATEDGCTVQLNKMVLEYYSVLASAG